VLSEEYAGRRRRSDTKSDEDRRKNAIICSRAVSLTDALERCLLRLVADHVEHRDIDALRDQCAKLEIRQTVGAYFRVERDSQSA